MDLLLVKNFTGSMEQAIQQLIGNSGPPPAVGYAFDHSTFNSRLRLHCDKLSTEVTKLSVIFSNEHLPSTEEAKDLLNAIDGAFVDVLSTFYTLPKEQGDSLFNIVHKTVFNMLNSVMAFIKTLSATGVQVLKERLSLTGQTWEACKAIENLPKDNLQAVCKIVQETEELVADALTEIEEEVKCSRNHDEDGNNSVSWSSLDLILLSPCVGLVKTVRTALKKIRQALGKDVVCNTAALISELDKVAAVVVSLSPSVDNLIASIYPPINRTQVQIDASLVVSFTENLLKLAKDCNFISEDENEWIDFLSKALQHNNNKLQSLLMPTT